MSRVRHLSMRTSHAGMTLIEILVAMSVFAILAALAYGGLNTVLDTREVVAGEADRLAEMQRSFARLGRDFEQAAPRNIRDVHGDSQPAMQSGGEVDEETQILAEFTLGGKRLLPGQQRSRLQRVAYAIKGNTLLRMNWSVLDRAQDSKPYITEILSGVESVEIQFLDDAGQWLGNWPADGQLSQGLPLAVELRFDIENWGELRRVFKVAG